jgi:hypothetical protein
VRENEDIDLRPLGIYPVSFILSSAKECNEIKNQAPTLSTKKDYQGLLSLWEKGILRQGAE